VLLLAKEVYCGLSQTAYSRRADGEFLLCVASLPR
jgi:hypothetical protein